MEYRLIHQQLSLALAQSAKQKAVLRFALRGLALGTVVCRVRHFFQVIWIVPNGKPNLDPWRLCWFFAAAWNACGVVSAAEKQRRLLGHLSIPLAFNTGPALAADELAEELEISAKTKLAE